MAKINYVTQQTWEPFFEKKSSLPSLTRESDYVPLEQLFAKFQVDELLRTQLYSPLSAQERDVLDSSTDFDDLVGEDLTVQKEFIDSVHDKLVNLNKDKEKVSEPTQTVKQDEPEQPATPDEVK